MENVIQKVADTLVRAGSTVPADKTACYHRALEQETSELGRWAMETIVQNTEIAREDRSPLCDDTGIPHLLLEVGKNRNVAGQLLEDICEGVRLGLRRLPGRPMAIKGSDRERIDQSGGLNEQSDAVLPAPVQVIHAEDENLLRLTVLMQGGGPEIRAKTYRVFHRHSMDVVMNEIVEWASASVRELGCSPCTLAVGIGRSHFEASALMIQAMAEGNYEKQNEYERLITERVNRTGVGAMGLGGDISVLGTFMKIGPQRASGVRIVCMRPCCCFEPRKASVLL